MYYYDSDDLTEYNSDNEEYKYNQNKSEKLHEEYFNEIQNTFDEMTYYVNYNSNNKCLLNNLIDYMQLSVLYDNDKYDFSDNFKKILNRDKLYISLPKLSKEDKLYQENDDSEEEEEEEENKKEDVKNNNFVTYNNTIFYKNLIKRKENRKIRIKNLNIKIEKRKIQKRKKMVERTKNILKRYGF